MAVRDLYIPGAMSRLYERLEGFVRDELNREVDAAFYHHNPDFPQRLLQWSDAKDRPPSRDWLRLRDKLLEEKRQGFILNKIPPEVFQGNLLRCWAAALESWLYVTSIPYPPSIRITQEQLVDQYGGLVGELETRKLNSVLGQFGATTKMFRINQLTYSTLLELLRAHGYLIVFYGTGSTCGHTVVVWGLFVHDNGHSIMNVMAPEHGRNIPGSFRQLREDYNAYIGWRSGIALK